MVNRSHSKLRSVEHGVHFVANFLLVLFFRLLSSSETYAFRRVVAMASIFFVGIIIPLNSPRMLSQTSIGFFSVSESHVALGFLPLVTIAHLFTCADPKRHLRIPSLLTSPWQPLSHRHSRHMKATWRSRSRYETCSVTDKTSPCRRRHFCHSVTGALMLEIKWRHPGENHYQLSPLCVHPHTQMWTTALDENDSARMVPLYGLLCRRREDRVEAPILLQDPKAKDAVPTS